MDITQVELKKILHYDKESGIFTWASKIKNQCKLGCRAGGCTHNKVNSYRRIKIRGKAIYEHRLAWLYIYGVAPDKQIDHIDGNRSNNAIANLRKVDPLANNRNRSRNKNNTSGENNIVKVGDKYRVKIGYMSKEIQVGYFEKLKCAIKARDKKLIELGYHELHGKSKNINNNHVKDTKAAKEKIKHRQKRIIENKERLSPMQRAKIEGLSFGYVYRILRNAECKLVTKEEHKKIHGG